LSVRIKEAKQMSDSFDQMYAQYQQQEQVANQKIVKERRFVCREIVLTGIGLPLWRNVFLLMTSGGVIGFHTGYVRTGKRFVIIIQSVLKIII